MKRFALSISLLTLALAGCKEDTLAPLPETVPLKMELSTDYIVHGESTDVTLSVVGSDAEAVLNEDILVEFSLLCSDADGNRIPSEEVFDGFEPTAVISQGEKSFSRTLTTKNTLLKYPINVELSAYSRGYTISGATQTLTLSDYYYVTISLQGNSDQAVYEGEKFIIKAELPKAPEENLTISVKPAPGQEDYCTDLPSELVILRNTTSVTSGLVTVVDSRETKEDRTLQLIFESDQTPHPIQNANFEIRVSDVDAPYGTVLNDERWVNPTPQILYVSSGSQAAVEKWAPTRMLQLMTEGDPHPSASEAGAEDLSQWKFLRSMEFHYTSNCMNNVNDFGNCTPLGLADQNTAKTQETQGVNNQKYSTVTEDGYLRMWCVKEQTPATGAVSGILDYGVSAFYGNKFDGNPGGMNQWVPQNVYILPGTRVEFRARIRGRNKGFNAALWLQGNDYTKSVEWPEFGEIDVMENPASRDGHGIVYGTLHYAPNDQGPSLSDSRTLSDIDEWNVYWCEILGDYSIRVGVNGQELGHWSENSAPGIDWPFGASKNPDGYHIILTLAGPNTWALGSQIPEDWDAGFSSITYEQSKTHNDTPRMEIDWIRFYKNSDYNLDGKTNKTQLFY